MMEQAIEAIKITVTNITVVQGMAPVLRVATTKDEMMQVLEAMQDELQAGREAIDKICKECGIE